MVLAFTFVGLTLRVESRVRFTTAGLTLAGSTFTAGTGLLFSALAIGCELRTAAGAGATPASLSGPYRNVHAIAPARISATPAWNSSNVPPTFVPPQAGHAAPAP